MKVRGSCSAVQWDGGLGNVTGIRRGTHLHVWGSACVFGSLPDALTLFTLPLASTASLLRCERREAKRERDRRRRKHSKCNGCQPKPELDPMADPRASFSLVLLSLRTARLDFTAPVERTPGIDETCGRGRRWAWDGRGSGFIGVASVSSVQF
jgi:hypothetical protein